MAEPTDDRRDPLSSALDDLVEVLARAGIASALIGGLATGYRARPRYTKDIDLLVDVPQVALPALLERASIEPGPAAPIRVATA